MQNLGTLLQGRLATWPETDQGAWIGVCSGSHLDGVHVISLKPDLTLCPAAPCDSRNGCPTPGEEGGGEGFLSDTATSPQPLSPHPLGPCSVLAQSPACSLFSEPQGPPLLSGTEVPAPGLGGHQGNSS